LLGLDEAQVSRLRHALRDVTEVEQGQPGASTKPAFRPNTGSMPAAHVPPLRKAGQNSDAPARPRGNLDALSPELVAKLTDAELATAFGLSLDEIKTLRTRQNTQPDEPAAPAEPKSSDTVVPVVATTQVPFEPPWRTADKSPSSASTERSAAPAVPAKSEAAKVAACSALFEDDDGDAEVDLFKPVAATRTAASPPVAAQTQDEPVAAPPRVDKKAVLFGDVDEGDDPLFGPKAPAKTTSAKKPLFDDEDEDDGLFAKKPAPAVVSPPPPLQPPCTAAAPPSVTQPVTRAKSLFDDEDDDDSGPLFGGAKSKPAISITQTQAPQALPAAAAQRGRSTGILDIGSGIGETEEDAAELARAEQSSEAVRAQMSAQLDELRTATVDAEREAESFEVSFSALEQKLASLEAKAGSAESLDAKKLVVSAAPAGAAATTGMLFSDDVVQDESVQRVESLLSTLNLLSKPAAEPQPVARGASIFDDAPTTVASLEPVDSTPAPASAVTVPSPAKRSVLFDSDNEDDTTSKEPLAPEACTTSEVVQEAAAEHNVSVSAAEEAVEFLQEAPAELDPEETPARPEPVAVTDSEIAVAEAFAPTAVAGGDTFDDVDLHPARPADEEVQVAPPDTAAQQEKAPAVALAATEAMHSGVALVRAPPAGGRVAAIAAAFASAGPAPASKPMPSGRQLAASRPQPAASALTEAAPAVSSPAVVESVATGSVVDVKRPAPPARGPRRLIGRPA